VGGWLGIGLDVGLLRARLRPSKPSEPAVKAAIRRGQECDLGAAVIWEEKNIHEEKITRDVRIILFSRSAKPLFFIVSFLFL
jgi:hypothetical protein